MIFPSTAAEKGCTRLVLQDDPEGLPVIGWVGVLDPDGVLDQSEPGLAAAVTRRRGAPLLVEHSRPSFGRPSLRGHRLVDLTAAESRDVAGRDWSTAFGTRRVEASAARLVIDADDPVAGLILRTEVEALDGGALRARHLLTNTGTTPYVVDGLEVCVPVPDTFTELLDFTGRHERERVPQRHPVQDGLWLRESRAGKPAEDSASLLVVGESGFGFGFGEVIGVCPATSGNSTLSFERGAAEGPRLCAGDLLLPGEVVLAPGESYRTPWVLIVAARDGLDSVAAALHRWQRGLPAHPKVQPVTLNVWEAVYFDHDPATLSRLAELAARVGVERFVLDDGWFHSRRNDRAGLGDWWVDRDVWPGGLEPLAKHVHALGMQFGLWFEPEMVNPDSDLFRAHPDWILATGGRIPGLFRNQLVLDLTRAEVWQYLRDQIDEVLSSNEIDYVKWDHNRPLVDAGSQHHGGSAAGHRQSLAFYALLDDLRRRHPQVDWESCAAGGGRIDLGVIERVQRFWTSDMTDALSRQQIQRWTGQFVAPEYLGAHISAPTSHQTGRTLPLGFRAGTALFGAFGIEWDLTRATEPELVELAEWCELFKRHRALLHSGRVLRIDIADPAVIAHGVIAQDRRSGLISHVQLDDSTHNRGVVIRIPGLDRASTYRIVWASPVDTGRMTVSPAVDPAGPTAGTPVSGAVLADVGIWMPRRRPQTLQLMHLIAE